MEKLTFLIIDGEGVKSYYFTQINLSIVITFFDIFNNTKYGCLIFRFNSAFVFQIIDLYCYFLF